VKGKPKIVTYWLAELMDPKKEPTLSDEHEDLRWLAKEDAKKLAGYKDLADMIDYFHSQILNL
jgi:bis(5'-nucleosidyl)-tetraphosphatase